ncbi:hypothetical protein [Nitrosomonas sp. Nm58]|uniref:hypothetical protein n=1 Tax=Nitrosomonas sp. Nm58 TaxID=200126 RepID=UPI00089B390F|nr:hypothetical protein [Nitrosomonas sp. Nm58]SDY15305.1 hypothetical protein SAMN05421754_1002123 [Nitrosomonas sp. Nm58]
MSKPENTAHIVTDIANNLIEKVSSPASRAGSVIERAGRMCEKGVYPDVIALQMTRNSPNSQTYTTNDVEAYSKLYQDSKTKVVITSKQARTLIKDQHEINPACDNLISQS